MPSLVDSVKREYEEVLRRFEQDLASVRTGRASPALVENVLVEAYNQKLPLKNLASISSPDAKTIMIQPWDKGAVVSIEKAILKTDLGLTPNNDGKVIRIPIPQLTQERRKELVKHVKKVAEEFRVSVRNHRRIGIERLKEMEKNKELTADEIKHSQERVQKITDDFIGRIDKALKAKEDEIMEV